MARLLSLLRPHLPLALIALALSFLAVAAEVGLLGVSGYLISRAALRPPTILLLMVPIVAVQLFSIGRASLRYVERLTSHDVTFRLLANVRALFYERLEAKPASALGGLHSGELLSRAVHDVDTVQDFYLRALAPPVVLLLTVALVFAVVFPMAPSVAWAASGLLLLGSLPAALQTRGGRRHGEEALRARAALSSLMADGVRGVSELLAYGAEKGYEAQVAVTQGDLLGAQGRLLRSDALSGALLGLVGNLAGVLALALAIPLVRAGTLPGWDLAAVALIVLASFEAAQPLPQSFQALGRCLAAGRRIFEIADAPTPLPEESQRHPAGLDVSVRGLTVRRAGAGSPALCDVSLDLASGRHVAIVGPSGAGKTTLIEALVGFAPVAEGALLIGGLPIAEIPRDALWAMSSVITQETTLFNVTLRENILLGRPDASQEELMSAVRAARLDGLVASLPQGLETPVGEQGRKLSGGERQRVAIARAILKDAPILMLDEPTEGLDAVTEEGVMGDILRLARGRSLLLVTHRLVGLEAMDEILVLSRGRVVERGRHAELVRTGGVYEQLWRLHEDWLRGA